MEELTLRCCVCIYLSLHAEERANLVTGYSSIMATKFAYDAVSSLQTR